MASSKSFRVVSIPVEQMMASLADIPRHLDSLPGETRDALVESAYSDLCWRLIRSVYIYPTLPVVVWLTTDYPKEHPGTLWLDLALVVVGCALRILGAKRRQAIARKSHSLWLLTMWTSVVLLAASVSLMLCHSIIVYGCGSWNFAVSLIWSAGIVSGGIVSFAPSWKLLILQTAIILVPPLFVSIGMFEPKSLSYAFANTLMFAFLVTQGRRTNEMYWEHLVGRFLESQRARELEVAKRAADEASLAKTRFLANMSHEIRTPMHGILGMAELTLATQLTKEQRENLETLRGSSQSLLHILNDILDLSKVESGKMQLETLPFQPTMVLDEVRRTLGARAELKGIKLESRITGTPVPVVGDAVRLRQVLLNLVGNAVKFTTEGSVTVTLDFKPAEDDTAVLTFAVKDTGPGIPAEKRAVVFEAFSQADSTVSRKFGGTGLGLAISAQLIGLMGSRIELKSEVGAGSCFSFTLNVPKVSQADEAQAAMVEETEETTPALRILLAEDNPVNQKLAVTMLSRLGHAVDLAENGQEAVDRFRDSNFDLVLLDNQMPVLSGEEAAREIRRIEASRGQARTPIVALTADAMSGDRARFIAAGMDDYLSKPFRAEDLMRIVRAQVIVSK